MYGRSVSRPLGQYRSCLAIVRRKRQSNNQLILFPSFCVGHITKQTQSRVHFLPTSWVLSVEFLIKASHKCDVFKFRTWKINQGTNLRCIELHNEVDILCQYGKNTSSTTVRTPFIFISCRDLPSVYGFVSKLKIIVHPILFQNFG